MFATAVIKFWFEDIEPRQRFKKDLEFDNLIIEKFSVLYDRAKQGALHTWRKHPLEALAEIIILDQFSRNMFRHSPDAFATDVLALVLAQEAIRKKFDIGLDKGRKAFLYMPFMHSESAEIHEIAMCLFDKPGMEDHLNYEIKHKGIIDRFGRYPHRNKILGRESTGEELEFLKSSGFSF